MFSILISKFFFFFKFGFFLLAPVVFDIDLISYSFTHSFTELFKTYYDEVYPARLDKWFVK